MDNDTVKQLTWSGLLAIIGALAAILARRLSAAVWVRVFNEDPPQR